MNYDELKRQHEENMARIRQAMAQMPDSATRLASTVDYLTAERDEWRRRALAAEATSLDIAAQAALDAQNWREELTAMRQRAEAAEADRTTLRAQRDRWKDEAYTATARVAELEATLAAVPVDAIMRTLFTGYRSSGQYTADANAINAWAAQQSEVQP